MPQMSPLLWLNMYIIMILLLIFVMIILNSMNLFFKILSDKEKIIQYNFKWIW